MNSKDYIIVIDRYISKYVKVFGLDKNVFKDIKHKDKIIYNLEGPDGDSLSIGEYVAFDIDVERNGKFYSYLIDKDKRHFEEQQKYADSVYPVFKKSFKKEFLGSIPVTSRFHIFSNQLYFYFYSEERYNFSSYAKDLRFKLGKNIFLFQVGARDMVRLSPYSKNYLTFDGRILPANMSFPMPSVAIDSVVIQNLEGRDIERLKGWSGKLDESLMYEFDLYVEESKKYPKKGQEVITIDGDKKGNCLSYNIMNGDVTIKTNENFVLRVKVDQLKFSKI